MKKFTALLSILVLSFSLTGCMFFSLATSDVSEKDSKETTEAETTTEEETTEEETTEEETTEEETTEEETTEESDVTYESLEEYFSTPEMQAQIESEEAYLLNLYGTVYSDVEYIAHGNTLSYVYTYLQSVDVDATSENIASSFKSLDMSDTIESLEDQTGIEGITLEFVYLNPDGSDVYRQTFTK